MVSVGTARAAMPSSRGSGRKASRLAPLPRKADQTDVAPAMYGFSTSGTLIVPSACW
jgi:hypothetical protein